MYLCVCFLLLFVGVLEIVVIIGCEICSLKGECVDVMIVFVGSDIGWMSDICFIVELGCVLFICVVFDCGDDFGCYLGIYIGMVC